MLQNLQKLIEQYKEIDENQVPLSNMVNLAKAIVLDDRLSKFDDISVWRIIDSHYAICISYNPVDVTIDTYDNFYSVRLDLQVTLDFLMGEVNLEFNEDRILTYIKENI